jgi:hypothetical protein
MGRDAVGRGACDALCDVQQVAWRGAGRRDRGREVSLTPLLVTHAICCPDTRTRTHTHARTHTRTHRELALESGVQAWGRVPALNTNPRFIEDLADAVVRVSCCVWRGSSGASQPARCRALR